MSLTLNKLTIAGNTQHINIVSLYVTLIVYWIIPKIMFKVNKRDPLATPTNIT